MNDIFLQFSSYASGVWRRRWHVVAIGWLVCGAGWTVVASLPDKYEASARIYADMDTMLGPLMRGLAVEMNLFQQLDIMQRTLMSRPNMEKVVLMTDLDLHVHTDKEKEALLERLGRRISLKQQGRNLFHVSYEDSDPSLAKRVVQAVLQIFVEGNLGASRQDLDATRRFIDSQIKDYEKQLGDTESKLAKFKRENMGLLPGEGNYYSNLQRLRQQLEKTEAAVAEGDTVRDELRQQLAAVPQFLETIVSDGAFALAGGGRGPESDHQIRILEMERLIDSLLTRYTEKHPDVTVARKRLETLKKEQEADLKAWAEANGANGSGQENGVAGSHKNMMPNPVYEKVKLQLVQHEASLAAMKRRVQGEQADLEKWGKMASLVPDVEAELQRLSRDHQMMKTGYDQLRLRQESARLARDLETKAQKVQFRIVDPPQVPIQPSGPNRPLFLSVVLLGGLCVGIAFAFLVSQINTTFTSIQRLRQTFALPVIGCVTSVVSASDRRRQISEIVSFGLVTASLLIAFSGLIAIELVGPKSLSQMIKGIGAVKGLGFI